MVKRLLMNKKCQVFTPEDYVKELLDSIEYKHDLYGKKILENSCGDGNILVAIVQRYIDNCKEKGMSRTRIKNGLSIAILDAIEQVTGKTVPGRNSDEVVQKFGDEL